jgi:hypothetical protein
MIDLVNQNHHSKISSKLCSSINLFLLFNYIAARHNESGVSIKRCILRGGGKESSCRVSSIKRTDEIPRTQVHKNFTMLFDYSMAYFFDAVCLSGRSGKKDRIQKLQSRLELLEALGDW